MASPTTKQRILYVVWAALIVLFTLNSVYYIVLLVHEGRIFPDIIIPGGVLILVPFTALDHWRKRPWRSVAKPSQIAN